MAAFIHRHTTTLNLGEVTCLLQGDDLSNRSDSTMSVGGCLDRLRQYLIDDILDELGPFHLSVAVNIDEFEESDEAVDHF